MFDKFKIICLECNSEDVYIEEDIDYDYEENPYVVGNNIICRKCGSNERV